MEYDTIEGFGYCYGEVEEKYVNRSSFTIGDLISLSEDYPERRFRFIGTKGSVGGIISWRGSYDIPAIEPVKEMKTGGEVADSLRKGLAVEHYGWKGGKYRYSEDDVFYVAEKGCSDEYQVVGCEVTSDEVVLITKIISY